MSKDDWNGGSGWGAITDPTGVLSGRVLVASAGISQTARDYVQKDIGTATTFSAIHYSSRIDYALLSTPSFADGKLGLISRATSIISGAAGNEYHAYFDVGAGLAYIDKIVSGVTTTLASAVLPSSVTTTSVKHTMEFKTYGLDPVTLQLFVDDNIIVNVGDTSSSKLTSGFPGLSVFGSTAYVDNFAILEYTSDGAEKSLWTPLTLTSSVLSVWLKSDTDVTTVTSGSDTFVSAWADQSGNSNDASQGVAANRPKLLGTTDPGSINNYPGIDFMPDGSTVSFLNIASAVSLDMQTTGVSIFVMINPDTTSGTGTIIDKTDTASGPTISYRLSVGGSSTNGLEYATASTHTSTADVISASNYQIAGVITNRTAAATTDTFGFFVNGTQQGNLTVGTATNTSTNLIIGDSASGSMGLNGKITEIIVVKGELSISNRQKIEGYLAHKYGTFVDLPSEHPFRNFAPTV